MNRQFYLKTVVIRVLMAAFFVGVLAACSGESHSNASDNSSPTQSSTKAPIATQSNNAPPPNSAQSSFSTNDGLLYISPVDFSCQYTLVLAADQVQYDVGTIQQMADYIRTLVPAGVSTTKSPGTPPSTLSLVSGTDASCQESFEVTNTSQGPLQISQINMQLTGEPETYSYHYRTIDVCSLPGLAELGRCDPLNIPAGGGTGSTISYTIDLGNGMVNGGSFQSQATPPIILYPNQLARIQLGIVPPKTLPNSLIYTLTPQISLIDAQSNPQTESLNQLKANFAFADANQFTCYTLQGDTFTQVGQRSDHQWCL